MSNEDSLSELNMAPARLMPKSPSLTEHHRILNLSAIHHGNTLATIKAHKVRQDNMEEQLEEIKNLRDDLWELKTELASQREANREHADDINRALTNQGALLGDLAHKFALSAAGVDIKKAIIQGVVAVLIAVVTAYGGYTMGHKADATYEPHTKAPTQQMDEKYKAFDPESVKHESK